MSDSTPKLIPLYRKTYLIGYALVDSDDYDRLKDLSWYLDKNGYVACKSRSVIGSVYMHRMVTMAPEGELVDHANHVRSDNRKANLRVCGHAQNSANVRKFRGKHGFRGIWKHNRSGAWQASVMVSGESHMLSGFKTPEEAARAYDWLALHHHGEYAVLNFPDDIQPMPEGFIESVQARKEKAANRIVKPEVKQWMVEERAKGRSARDIAIEAGVDKATVFRIIKQARS